MITRTTTRHAVVLGPILAAILITPASRAQSLCSDATMKGAYVLSQTGTQNGTPFAIVGEATYNGHGGGSVTATEMRGGTLIPIVGAPATFKVNPDCSGSKTVGPFNFNFVITPDGKTITFVQTDSGVVSAGKAKRLTQNGD